MAMRSKNINFQAGHIPLRVVIKRQMGPQILRKKNKKSAESNKYKTRKRSPDSSASQRWRPNTAAMP